MEQIQYSMSLKFFTTSDVAILYGVTQTAVRQWILRGLLIPERKVGGWCITEANLREFEKRRSRVSTRGPARAVRKYLSIQNTPTELGAGNDGAVATLSSPA